MTNISRIITVAAVLLAGAAAHAGDPDPEAEARALTLDMAKLVAYEKSTAALIKLDKGYLRKANDAIGASSPFPDDWVKDIEKLPPYAAAIRQGFKSIKEYVLVGIALNETWIAVDKKKSGKPEAEWKGKATPESFAFVEKNADRVRKATTALADRLSGP